MIYFNWRTCAAQRPVCTILNSEMMAAERTQRAVHEFVAERGGRVRQTELMDHFLSPRAEDQGSPGEEGVRRELLESAVASVALVEVAEDGVKFVRLREEGSAGGAAMHDECNGNVEEEIPRDSRGGGGVNGNPDSRGQTGEREAPCVRIMMKYRRSFRFSGFLLLASADGDSVVCSDKIGVYFRPCVYNKTNCLFLLFMESDFGNLCILHFTSTTALITAVLSLFQLCLIEIADKK